MDTDVVGQSAFLRVFTKAKIIKFYPKAEMAVKPAAASLQQPGLIVWTL